MKSLASGIALGALLALGWPQLALPQAAPPVARGLYNWVHTTGNAERAFAFYRDVFGIELTRSPFLGSAPPNAPGEGIRPVEAAGSDELVWNLTNTHGSRFRTVFMRAPNTPFGLELSEFFDIPREERAANPWDPGASLLIFRVRDLDAVRSALAARGAPVVTLPGALVGSASRGPIVVRDPDGYLVHVSQAAAAEVRVAAPGVIVATSIGISVADSAQALAFYRDLMGFEVRATRRTTGPPLALYGLANGELEQTTLAIVGTDIIVELLQFRAPSTEPVRPFRWRIEDVGAPQFQLEVQGLDALLGRTRAAGYRFLSVEGRPIDRPFGRFVFAIDPDGVLVEYVEPTRRGQN